MLSQPNSALGSKGATRQSWRASSPRDLLAEIVDGNAGRSQDEILALFESEVRGRDEFLSTIIEYWFTNNYRSLMLAKDAAANSARFNRGKHEVKQKAAELGEVVSQSLRTKTRLMLLDLMMPNGRRLRACTGEECRKLSKSTGRWLIGISREVPARTKVGEILSEERLHELYDAAA